MREDPGRLDDIAEPQEGQFGEDLGYCRSDQWDQDPHECEVACQDDPGQRGVFGECLADAEGPAFGEDISPVDREVDAGADHPGADDREGQRAGQGEKHTQQRPVDDEAQQGTADERQQRTIDHP